MSVFVPTGIGTLLRLGGNFRLEIAAMKVLCHQNSIVVPGLYLPTGSCLPFYMLVAENMIIQESVEYK
jgi:hypothetical protein